MTGVHATPDDQRDAIVMAVLPHVPFDGWGLAALRRAADSIGLGADAATRLFPGGAAAAVAHFMALADRLMVSDLAAHDLASMKIRERIAMAVKVRLQRWQPHKEAVRRALAIAPFPPLAGRTIGGWYNTVDAIWRAIGDKSVDFSFYTKRALLAGVYAATLLYWIDDTSEDASATWAFLDRRIADVMKIPKLRAAAVDTLRFVPNPIRIAQKIARRFGGGLRSGF